MIAEKLSVAEVELDGVTLIEASAGTGKTQTIATLFVRMLLEKGHLVSEILVVTYTRAATAELRQRIRHRLGQALETFDEQLAGRPPLRELDADLVEIVDRSIARGHPYADRLRLDTALHGFDEASIFTIHGFCQRVLQQSAFESGARFDVELIENQQLLLDEVVHDYWANTLYDSSERFARYVMDALDVEELVRFAAQVAGDPDLGIVPDLDEGACDEALAACVPRTAEPSDAELALGLLAFKARFVRYVRAELPQRKRSRGLQGFDDLLVVLRAAVDGPNGEALIEEVRKRHPVALIDEFQDTDPVQCRVFERIYDPHAKAPLALFLIGDPKQAIYAFRGADVFAYMRAARETATRSATLQVNYRSDPRLVHAVNHLWQRVAAPFLFEDIGFQPVDAGRTARVSGTLASGPALEIAFLPLTAATVNKRGKSINKEKAAEVFTRHTADEIVRLLGSDGRIEGERVLPKDIAVLCRTNRQARDIQDALRERGVPAVLDGDDSVFESEIAVELDRVLSALCEPTSAPLVRAALATSILGQTAADLLALAHEESLWDEWLAAFRRWHELWEAQSVVHALYALIDEQAVAQRLLTRLDGERRLTDLRHLLELLHVQERERQQGSFALSTWYRRMRVDSRVRLGLAAEATQIRLESDAHAVTLTTIHKSKGLDYPIVYCPFLWDAGALSKRDTQYLKFHDDSQARRRMLDHADKATRAASHLEQGEREALAEALRLLYVALTRAKHRVTITWGRINLTEGSALGYLLHQVPDGALDTLAARTRTRIAKLSDAELLAELHALEAGSEGTIGVRVIAQAAEVPRYLPMAGPSSLQLPRLPKAPRDRVRASSFSGLAASGASGMRASLDDARDLDAADEGLEPPEPRTAAGTRVALADFPAGAVRGRLIHTIYETIDFRAATAEVLAPQVALALSSYGMEAEAAPLLCDAIFDTLVTPIEPSAGLPQLSCLGPQDRLMELEFVFPVAHAAVSGARPAPLRAQTLAAVLTRHARDAAERGYVETVAALPFSALHGYLRGFIDLVARHDGRYYVLDYKSNHLGPHAEDYGRERMREAMFEHHYVLQYLLYSVAVHRHLSLRLPDYDYERHFGGVYYLFVRGMAPAHAPGTGIFAERPTHALISELSEALRDPAGAS